MTAPVYLLLALIALIYGWFMYREGKWQGGIEMEATHRRHLNEDEAAAVISIPFQVDDYVTVWMKGLDGKIVDIAICHRYPFHTITLNLNNGATTQVSAADLRPSLPAPSGLRYIYCAGCGRKKLVRGATKGTAIWCGECPPPPPTICEQQGIILPEDLTPALALPVAPGWE
jgi:hypothetical protein